MCGRSIGRAGMSDLTRGNLVFGSLNTKRARVSLNKRIVLSVRPAGWEVAVERATRTSSMGYVATAGSSAAEGRVFVRSKQPSNVFTRPVLLLEDI